AIHALDPDEAGLQFMGPTSAENASRQQVELFERCYHQQRLEVHPGIEYAIRWLKKHLPVAAKVVLNHGDYKRGNFLLDDDTITGIIDWEQCHLGDPMEDIAFTYWYYWTLEVVVPLDEFIPLYEKASGITVDKDTLAFYRIFLELKMAVVALTSI